VQVYADITSPAIVSHTFKVFYKPDQLRVLNASRNEAAWYFHDGARAVAYPGPNQAVPGEVLFIGGRMDARDPQAGVTGNRMLLGSIVFSRTTPETPSFDLPIGRAGQFASFVTPQGAVLEAQPGEVRLLSVKPDAQDEDLDGLLDGWEIAQFGTTRGVFYSDDGDGDGVNNLDEQALGSDPHDAASNLRLALAGRGGRMSLSWPSAEGRRYIVEMGKSPGKYEVLKEGIKATPPMNLLDLDPTEPGEAAFFRVRLETTPTR
jgi:hypothetical protein